MAKVGSLFMLEKLAGGVVTGKELAVALREAVLSNENPLRQPALNEELMKSYLALAQLGLVRFDVRSTDEGRLVYQTLNNDDAYKNLPPPENLPDDDLPF